MNKKNDKDTFNLRTNRNTRTSSLISGFASTNPASENSSSVKDDKTEVKPKTKKAVASYTNSIVDHLINASSGLDSVLIDIDDLYAAPDEWNFYDRLPASKMQELLESIISIGLQEPIIVWKKDNSGKYMILSGHNRVHAFKILRDNQDHDKYSKIHAVIKESITSEEEAKEIIVDTNWVQRQLTTIQKAKSISFKYKKLKKDSLARRVKFDINAVIADEYHITSRQIFSYKSLSDLSPKCQSAVDFDKLSIKAGVALAKFSDDDQNYIIENYDIQTLNKRYSKIKNALDKNTGSLDKDKLDEILNSEELSSVTVKLKPKYKEAFIEELQTLIEKYNIQKIL